MVTLRGSLSFRPETDNKVKLLKERGSKKTSY